jgi:hypothetical protein
MEASPGTVIRLKQNNLLEIGGCFVARLLPRDFNPISAQPYEAAKRMPFQVITLGMVTFPHFLNAANDTVS